MWVRFPGNTNTDKKKMYSLSKSLWIKASDKCKYIIIITINILNNLLLKFLCAFESFYSNIYILFQVYFNQKKIFSIPLVFVTTVLYSNHSISIDFMVLMVLSHLGIHWLSFHHLLLTFS